jgi:transposase
VANQLKMATLQSILSLHEKRWSYRRIARELGIDRGTVARYVRLAREAAQAERSAAGPDGEAAESKPAIAPIGSNPKSANAPIGSEGPASRRASSGRLPGRQSDCEPWREVIRAKAEQGLSAKGIHQDLVGDLGACVSYDSVRRFLRRLGRTRPLPFRRMECKPGEEVQVDFGKGAPVMMRERQVASTAAVPRGVQP